MRIHRDVKITMYQLGHKPKHHYLRYFFISIIVIGLLGGGYLATKLVLQSNTILTQSKAVTKFVPVSSVKTQHITQASFSFDLPDTWQRKSTQGGVVPLPVGSWQGTVGDDKARWIDVYIDAIPVNFAANRLLPVQANGSAMDVTGVTSDNCTNFTDKATQPNANGAVPAKWSGVSFLCDVGNYERDVVAIGSPEGVNVITLTGAGNTRHRVFLVYTDNSPNPDYTIFASAVKSFRVL